jgi:hypothetical protein
MRLLPSLLLALACALPAALGAKEEPPAARERALAAAYEVMNASRYAALVTRGKDGYSQARIVDPLLGPDRTIWIATNPLTRKVEEIRRDGRVWYQAYERGAPKAPLEAIGNTDRRGTKMVFKPDVTIFSNIDWAWDVLNNRLREISFLNAGLTINLRDERDTPAREQTYHFEGGIREFVRQLSKNKTPLHEDVIYIQRGRIVRHRHAG